MPKGHKVETGYATVSSEDGCLGYREIAEKMTEDGHAMNHSTARNVFLRAMKKIANPIAENYGSHDARKLANDPRFQSCVQEILSEYIDI
tara:strand:+ start:220 stop:489 length:270 start_codon:yes stop_codon:yes gene_type:complete